MNISFSSCDSYNWNGNLISSSGLYIDTLVGANNCDSIVNLDLTILNSSSSFDTITASSCNNWRMECVNYSSSGLYSQILTNSVGCDSTAYLDLTILNSSSSFDTVSSCYGYNWNSLNLTS